MSTLGFRSSSAHCLMFVVRLSVVANKLQSSKHGAHSEEAQDLRSDDADGCKVLPADVSDSAEN